jgi:5'-phosphate synthase pdxT subunit
VLAIQGDFEAHARSLEALGCEAVEIRRPAELDEVHALVLPGGESTTISKGLAAYGLEQPLRDFAARGRPVLGTCAGLIVLDRMHLRVMDIEARRNAFGRQLRSFETDLLVAGLGEEALRAVFIRAPWIERWGTEVEVLAELEGHPVVARQRNVIATAFHPELTDDLRLHALFLSLARADGGRGEAGDLATSAGTRRARA